MNNSYNSLDWKKLPWVIFLFILAVFVFATPYNLSWHITADSGWVQAAEVAGRLGGGNVRRQIALFVLGILAL